MHGLRYDYASAERCFERAVGVAPQKTEALALAGINSRDFRNPEIARALFQRAVATKKCRAGNACRSGRIIRAPPPRGRCRSVDRAGFAIEWQLRPALLGRARLDRQRGHLDKAEKLSPRFPADADRIIRVRARYELGGILDRQGRYDEAMTAFSRSKAILNRTPRCCRRFVNPARPLKNAGGKLLHGHISALV